MANERALGLWFLYAAQTWRQLVICYGEDEARTLFGLTNNIVVFGFSPPASDELRTVDIVLGRRRRMRGVIPVVEGRLVQPVARITRRLRTSGPSRLSVPPSGRTVNP